jgi:hypothetical protein
MISREEFRIRKSILAEYQAGNSEELAFLNISAKFGVNFTSEDIIKRWYQRFRSGDWFLLDKNTSQCYIVPAVQTLANGNEVRNFKV